jgi:hypothetical protein
MSRKWIAFVLFAALASLPQARPAHAEPDSDCMEVGWRDGSDRAWLDSYEESSHMHMRYDYRHGKLELKVREKEGGELIVMKGKWFEGEEGHAGKEGAVFLKMERGHHRAKGWYSYGFEENARHYDFVLRDCKR